MCVSFPLERDIVFHERASRSYSISAYYLAKLVCETPFKLGPYVLFFVASYWPLHYSRTATQFSLFLLIASLTFMAMNAVGLAVGDW